MIKKFIPRQYVLFTHKNIGISSILLEENCSWTLSQPRNFLSCNHKEDKLFFPDKFVNYYLNIYIKSVYILLQ